MKPWEETVEVGSVILATGFEEMDPRKTTAYAYARYENVMTGLEFERLLNASGPTSGEIRRPTDMEPPQRIVFVQCVGSRDLHSSGKPYCSSYCCMNSIKSALLSLQHEPDLEEVCILYMDIRAYGRGFEELYRRAQEEPKIRFIRGRPARVDQIEANKDLLVHVERTNDRKVERIEAGMVVLAAGAVPPAANKKLADVFDIELDEYGFLKSGEDAIQTNQEGIFLAGSCSAPRDITESVVQGSAASARASAYLKGQKVVRPPADIKPLPTEGDARVGVFVCHCGSNIAGVLDVERLAGEASSLRGVVHSSTETFACSDVSVGAIEETIVEKKLNRVVVAACTPRTHEPIFREALSRVGLNPYLLEMVNVRDQCSWVHFKEPEKAQIKAEDLIRMGVARARELRPLEARSAPVTRSALVVGGGIGGLTAARDLSRIGMDVTVVERSENFGGRRPEDEVESLVDELRQKEVPLLASTEVESVEGFVGNFHVKLCSGNGNGRGTQELDVGGIILAVGAQPLAPEGHFGYGSMPAVITTAELDKALAEQGPKENGVFTWNGKPVRGALFIQCVGSRDDERPYCGRICCRVSVRQAQQLRSMNCDVTVLYRDMRVYGIQSEDLYRRSRAEGVTYMRFQPTDPPRVEEVEDGLVVSNQIPGQPERVEIPVDLVVLSVPLIPDPKSIAQFQEILKVSRASDGFFLERHSKLGPVETPSDGIFICGTARSPKLAEESVDEASAAAGRLAELLSSDELMLDPTTCSVTTGRCRACGTCVEACLFGAPQLVPVLEDGKHAFAAQINEAKCKGCGTCAALCPTGAIEARHFTEDQIRAALRAALEATS
jgi:heterodisulfide reductase subunit A